MKPWLERNTIEMYLTHNEETFVVAKRLIRTLRNKTYKYMTSISKNVYIDNLDDIFNKYNNRYHIKIKMQHVNLKSNTCIISSKKVNDKDPKFEVGNIVRILRYQNI